MPQGTNTSGTPMRLVFLGPPGAGKGTQAQKFSAEFGIPRISTGDVLREEMAGRTELGLQAKAFVDSGRLVPDDLMIGVIEKRLAVGDASLGFILDGFPRTVAQAEALEGLMAKIRTRLDAVILFEVPEEELIRRLTGRLSCPRCERIYHREFNPPRMNASGDPICSDCGSLLAQRKDDVLETVRERLSVYRRQTEPLVAYYRESGVLASVEGNGPMEKISLQLKEAVIRKANKGG